MKRLKIRLRTVFISTCLIAAVVAWLTHNLRTYRHEQMLIRKLEAMAGPIFLVDSKHPPAPPFGFLPDVEPLVVRDSTWPMNTLPAMFHPEVFERVSSISMFDCKTTDEMVDLISGFKSMKYLQIPANAVSEQTLDSFRRMHPQAKIVIDPVHNDANYPED